MSNMPCGTYFSDPDATHTVECISTVHGCGIYGYYTNEFDAHRVRKSIANTPGTTLAVVKPYNPEGRVSAGIHPYVEYA